MTFLTAGCSVPCPPCSPSACCAMHKVTSPCPRASMRWSPSSSCSAISPSVACRAWNNSATTPLANGANSSASTASQKSKPCATKSASSATTPNAPPAGVASSLVTGWAQDSQAAGVLLIDGHTRVYHGSLTKLPRRYISRERLCLRATTDYWVNALDGQPFFCVTNPIDPGLQTTLEDRHRPPPPQRQSPINPPSRDLTADPHLPPLHPHLRPRRILPGPLRAVSKPNTSPSSPITNTPAPTGRKTNSSPATSPIPTAKPRTLLLAERGTRMSQRPVAARTAPAR